MKFVTFERQAKLVINRLKKIKEKVEVRVVIPDINEQLIVELGQYQDECQAQNSTFEKTLSRLLSSEVSSEDDDENISIFQEEVFELTKSIQILLIPFLKKYSDVLPSSNVSSNVSLSLKLPPLVLKTFSGVPEQWLSFHSLFEASVHNNTNLSDTEKFQYLLTSLEGEPLNLVKNLPITPENYKVAWNILNDRYKNNRNIIIHYVNHLLDLQPITNPCSKNIRVLIANFQENSQALLALKYDVTKNNIVLSTLLLRKLDSVLCKKFEESRMDSQKIPEVREIISFLENECTQMEAANLSHQANSKSVISNTSSGKSFTASSAKPSSTRLPRTVLMSSSTQSPSCAFCDKHGHVIYKCTEFQTLTPQEKFEFVKKRQFCFNCLGTSHNSKDCKSTKVCSHCAKRHHSWLHLPVRTASFKLQNNDIRLSETRRTSVSTSADDKPNSNKNPVVVFSQNKENKYRTMLLGTTLVQIHANNGNSLVVRGVVDSGSMVTCISEHVARLLALDRWTDSVRDVDGLSSSRIKTKGVSRINISALNGTKVADDHAVIILDKITSNLPHAEVPIEVKQKFANIVLADPTFNLPGSIDILIGADLFTKIITGESVIVGENLPAAMNSLFGYIIIGPAPLTKAAHSRLEHTTLLATHDCNLSDMLQRFWILEEPPLKSTLSLEEEACEKHYMTHHSRDLSTGRYTVRLPFKPNHPPLGNSEETAKRRFLALEKRLNSDEVLKEEYTNCIQDYLVSGHMKLASSGILKETDHFYLPHHAVIKEESSSTKVRVVFDASAKSSNGISLNQTLFSGQKLHNDLCDILVRFRFYPIVFLCDIKQMFRQIQMHPKDCKYQLLYWRENSSQQLLTYCLTTVVFGFVCSPFLAIRTLRQLIQDEGDKYPRAAAAVKNQVYVDDIILGANSLAEARSLKEEVIGLLANGGFDLRKWFSNHPDLVSDLPEDHVEKPLYFCSPENPLYSVLGIKWIAESDQFAYKLQAPVCNSPTKRKILSSIAQIFDPCGFLTPVIFWTKALMQLLWSLGLQWDEPVPNDISEKWKRFCLQLSDLDNIKVERNVFLFSATNVQLHGFSDGSEVGYSAVVYVRTVSSDSTVNISLLLAKSRVAPLKRISIPRLELCGAHLLANLLDYSYKLISQHCKVDSITAWCDSAVTLSWIHTPPYRLKVYIANRVAQIQELTPSHIWTHISSNFNPADCASRGLLPSDLLGHKLWWNGPPWLRSSEDCWPTPCFTPVRFEDLPEIKLDSLKILVTTVDCSTFMKFSSWMTLLRVIAYVIRFIWNTQNSTKKKGALELKELDIACVKICKTIQTLEFQEDISRLKAGKLVTSRLQALSPFLDNDGLLRVGGRIQKSHLSYAAKHPIIMPKSHHVVNLIIDYYHLKYLHAGPQFLQACISKKFWILSARSIIRNRVFKCIRCFRCQPKLTTQKMGELPSTRVSPTSRVFFNTGTDFLGPFLIKPNNIRKTSAVKMYLCVFICLAVKAVHIEVVSSLTTEAFLAALTRFISRRGICANIYSDCGTNYVGAASEMKKITQALFKKEDAMKRIDQFSQEHSIIFHFLPPAAPHQGGLWERTVRSIKHHLRRAVGEQILNFEEFLTLTSRIEAILNSRPLTPLSSDPAELDFLTPGHFLTGGPLVALPELQWREIPSNRLSRWQLVQAVTQNFWKRWSQEYLHTLQQRRKWTSPQENVKVGDMVLIHEPNTPPLLWNIGRVCSTSPGTDGLVRVVQLRTSRGELSRPVNKVSPLPIDY